MQQQPPDPDPFELRLGGGKGDPLVLHNPVIAASGCFPLRARRWTVEDLRPLGAVCTPSVSARTRPGGERFAVEECPAGLLLRGGYPTLSVRRLRDEILPRWPRPVPLIATIHALDPDECGASVAALAETGGVAAVELAVGDPDGAATATDAGALLRLTDRVRRIWPGALLVKLSHAAATGALAVRLAEAGADALSLGGGFAAALPRTGDGERGPRPGRLVGPATRPLVLRRLGAVVRASPLPVIAAGGVASAEDALAFLQEGAAAVQVGSIALRSPTAAVEISRAVAARLAAAEADGRSGTGGGTVIGC